MANNDQIRQAFHALGALYAAEHHEADDKGAQMVQRMTMRLRRFKAHEDQEHSGPKVVRESTYQLHDGRSVYYDDGQESRRDAADVYSVIPELDDVGSPNLENMQARHILARSQTGLGLSPSHIGELRKLLGKHRKAVDVLRVNRSKADWLDVAPGSAASLMIDRERGTDAR